VASGLSRTSVFVLGLLLAGSLAAAVTLTIDHEPVSCLIAGEYPLIEACFEPGQGVARARVYFRASDTLDWYYVEMAPEASCFQGVLPRPAESTAHIDYYVSVTDETFEEVRTQEYETSVVTKGSECDGVLAAYVSTASVVVGAVAGAAFPAGFVGGTILTTTAVAGLVATGVVTGVGITEGGVNESPPPTTTAPPAPAPTPTPTPIPVPTPTPAVCLPEDDDPPEVAILEPSANADVGATVEIVAEITDPGPASSGIAGARMFAEEQGGPRAEEIASLEPPGPLYRATWLVPDCMGPQDRWYIHVQATDRCGLAGGARVRVKRRGDSCSSSRVEGEGATSVLWTSDLELTNAQGQVIVNGSHALFPGAGPSPLNLPVRLGRNRVEATLVSTGEEGGVWRFTLDSGNVKPGSLRPVAGEVAAVGPGLVAFHLAGRAGERVVFTFDLE
jgi:hypothetical protein